MVKRADRKKVRALRQHIKARSHARRAEKLDPDESWKKKRGKGEEQPEQSPEHEERTNQRPFRRNPAAMRELPGPLGPGARLRRRRPEPDEDIDDVEVITEDADTQEAVDTLTGMLGEIGGVTSFSGTAPGLGAVVAALRSRGYTPGDITGVPAPARRPEGLEHARTRRGAHSAGRPGPSAPAATLPQPRA